jgi:serine/threonine protein kinase
MQIGTRNQQGFSRRRPRKLNWQNIGWRHTRFAAGMESEVSFTRLVRAIFDAFQGMTRTSAVVSDQTESEAVLHRNRNDGDDEDAAFRSHVSPLLMKFRDENMERTYQASLRAHRDSQTTTAMQALVALSLVVLWAVFVLTEFLEPQSEVNRIAGNTTKTPRTTMLMGKTACFGPCLSVIDIAGFGLIAAYKYVANHIEVMGSTLRFFSIVLSVGFPIFWISWMTITKNLKRGQPFVWNAHLASLFRDGRSQSDDPYPRNSPYDGLTESSKVIANLIDRYDHENGRCMYDDGDGAMDSGGEESFEACAASSYQTMFVAYSITTANNKIITGTVAMLSIFLAINLALGKVLYFGTSDIVIGYLLLISQLYSYAPWQYAHHTLMDSTVYGFALYLMVRENESTTRRQFYSSWQRALLLEEETAKLSIDSLKMNTALLSAERRFELLTKARDVVDTPDATVATSSKLLNSEQWALSANLNDALLRRKDFGGLDHVWQVDFNEISGVRRLKSGSAFDTFRGKYRDEDVMIKRPAAAPDDSDSVLDKKIARFGIEMELLSALNHRNVVAMIGASWEDQLCLVLEYPRCGLLAQVVREEPAYLQQHWHEILLDVANGLSFLQSHHRICHRNISPGCIFVQFNGLYSIGELHDCVQYPSNGAELTVDQPSCAFNGDHINDLFHVAPEVHRGTTKGVFEADSTCDSYSFGMLALALCISPSSLRDAIEGAHAQRPNESGSDDDGLESKTEAAEDSEGPTFVVDDADAALKLRLGESSGLPNDQVSVDFVVHGWRPRTSSLFSARSDGLPLRGMEERVVNLIKLCWSHDASRRPVCAELVREMHQLIAELKEKNSAEYSADTHT